MWELVQFVISHRVHSPDAKKVSTREADWLEGYARAYNARIIVNAGHNWEYDVPDGLNEELW